MIESPTILLIASDEAVVSAAAASLGAAHYRTLTGTAPDAGRPDLVLRQWDDRANGPIDTSAPVLHVDLTRLGEQELVELVDRAVGFPAIVMRSALGSYD